MKVRVLLLCLAILVPVGGEHSPVSGQTVVKEIKPAQKNRVVQPQARKKRNRRPDPPRKDDRKEDEKKQARIDKPVDNPTLFKDLKEGETFYFPTDADHQYFPYVKLSATTAKSVATATSPVVQVIPMTADTQVVGDRKKGGTGEAKGKGK